MLKLIKGDVVLCLACGMPVRLSFAISQRPLPPQSARLFSEHGLE
jgi:hypothetical protein